jgi:LytR cell envelope-related transcriptional attenuator
VGRVRSWFAAPAGARVLGIAFAIAGVALLGLGVFAFGGSGGSAAAPAPSPSPSASAPPSTSASPSAPATPSATAEPTSQLPATTPPPPPQTTSQAPARAPLTVLNNSTIRGLGERAAAQARAKGWQVASIGNFAGVIPVTTVYYTPGNPGEEAAAKRLQADLPQVSRVLPRYAGLPPTPTGVVLVVTRDWS